METEGRATTVGSTGGSSTAERVVDQATPAAQAALGKVSEVTRPMVNRAAAGAEQAVDKIAGAAGRAGEVLGEAGAQLKDLQARALEQSRVYVRDHPIATFFFAIAAGFLLSRLTRGRSH